MTFIIVPVYNVEQYLERCIRSIMENSYKDLEIICVNDGSRDRCLDILGRLADEDARILIVNQRNQGVQTARNNGIKAATGEYIAFVDSDDWIHPQYFQSLLTCMEQTGADISVCGCQEFEKNEEVVITDSSDIPYHKLSGKQFFNSYYARHMCWGRLYRKKDIENIGFISKVRMADDTLFNLSVVSRFKNPVVYGTDIPLYYYFQRPNSIVKTATYEKTIDLADWTVENYKTDVQHVWSWMLTMQAMKMALSFRYGARLYEDQKAVMHAERMLQKLLVMMKQSHLISRKDILLHAVMIRFPGMYRYFCIKDDSTMKIWEANVRSRHTG